MLDLQSRIPRWRASLIQKSGVVENYLQVFGDKIETRILPLSPHAAEALIRGVSAATERRRYN